MDKADDQQPRAPINGDKEDLVVLIKDFLKELVSRNALRSLALVFIIISISVLLGFYFYLPSNPFVKVKAEVPLNLQIDSLRNELKNLKYITTALNSDLDTIRNLRPNKKFQLSTIVNLKIKTLEERITKLEKVLLTDTEKAVNMVLQKKDIQNNENKIDQMAKFLDQSVGYMYSLIVSVVVVIAVGFFTVAISLKKD